MIRRKTIKTAKAGELLKTVAKLAGAVPYSMSGYFPVSDNTMRHSRSKLLSAGDLERIRRGGQNYLIPGQGLLEEDSLVARSPHHALIEGRKWSRLYHGGSQMLLMAFLAGAEVRGLHIKHDPDVLGSNSGRDERVLHLTGLLPKEEGDDDFIEDDLLERARRHNYPFPLFIDKPEYIGWVERMKARLPKYYRSGLKYVGMDGILYVPGANAGAARESGRGIAYVCYFIDDVGSAKFNENREGILCGILKNELGADVHGLFVINGGADMPAKLLAKPRRLFGDGTHVHGIGEAGRVQAITGRLQNAPTPESCGT
jgi:hypothetical protein